MYVNAPSYSASNPMDYSSLNTHYGLVKCKFVLYQNYEYTKTKTLYQT
jgi:hypothetical protein